MVNFGQYPLVYQLQNGVPIGLAETSSVGYLSSVNLVVSSISATVYQGLSITGSFSFTGIQTIDSTGTGGGDLIFTSTLNSVTLRKITITNGFLQATSTGVDDPNVTIQYGPTPLPYANGGTNNNITPLADSVAYWKDDGFGATRLFTDGGFTFASDKLSIPVGGQYQINGSQIAISDLKDIPAPTVANTYLQYIGGGNYQWTGVTGTGGTGTTITIPTTPGRVLISVDSTSVTSDPQLTYNSGNDTLNTYAINNVCDVCAIRFNEGGLLLVDKYVSKSTTGSFALTSTLRDLAYVSQVDLQATSVTGVAQVSKGGTGLSLLTPGTFLVGNGTTVSLQPTASFETTANAATTYLPKALVGQLAYKDQIDLQTTSVTGVLQVTKGGLGRSTTTINRILVGGAANTVDEIVSPSTGYLRWTGTAFAWESPTGTVSLPTDPCAVVFMNATGTGLTSNPGIRINTAATCATLEIFSNQADGTGGIDVAPDIANEGFIRWDHDYDTLGIVGIDNTNIALGVDEIIPITNNTGVTLQKGIVVYVSGSSGGSHRGTVGLLSNSNRSASILGVCLHSITNTNSGYIIKKGLIKNVSRTTVQESGETWAVGDTLYVGPTAGKLTNIHPPAGNRAAKIGIVLDLPGSNVSFGVNVDRGYDLSELHDVCATPSNNGDILIWNASVTGYYANGNINDITGTLSITKGGTGTTTFNNKSVLFYNSLSIPPALTTDSSFIFEDNILKSPTVCATTVCATTISEGGQTLITKYYDRASTAVFALTGSLRDLAYVSQVDLQTTSVTGVIQVSKGGTGLSTLTAGSFLVGNGTSVSLQPTASFETTGYSRANYATIVSLNSYVPTSTYVAFTGTLRDLAYKPQVDLETTSVTGVAQVSKGGTGLATLTAGNFLVGNGTTVVLQPTASFETTSHAAATYLPNTAELNDLSDVEVTSTPGDGQVLKYTSGKWRPGADNTGAGSTSPGGENTNVQFNNAGSFGGNAGLTYNSSTSSLRAQDYQNLPSATPIWNASSIKGFPVVSSYAGPELYPTTGQTLLFFEAPVSGWYYGTPAAAAGGSNNQIQYNSGGGLVGSPALTWDNSTSTLVSKQLSATSYLNLPSSTPLWNANKLDNEFLKIEDGGAFQAFGLGPTLGTRQLLTYVTTGDGASATGWYNISIGLLGYFINQESTLKFNADRLQGTNISTATPSTGDTLTYNGTNWAPTAPSTGASVGVSYILGNNLIL